MKQKDSIHVRQKTHNFCEKRPSLEETLNFANKPLIFFAIKKYVCVNEHPKLCKKNTKETIHTTQ